MADILNFPRPMACLTEESALCELILAEACHEEARNRPMYSDMWIHAPHEINVPYYRATIDRLHEAQRWLKVATENTLYGP